MDSYVSHKTAGALLNLLHRMDDGYRLTADELLTLRESSIAFFSQSNLEKLPESIGELSQLKVLYMSINHVSSLPESIGKLSHLMVLDVAHNELTGLPENIGKLSQLTRLNICFNKLTDLPESIGALSQLSELELFDNQLTHLPESIGALAELTKLDLSRNQLTNLPKSIGALSNLTALELSSNQLTYLPESIGTLSQLTELDLSLNRLDSLPESIGTLSQLTELNLSCNQLTSLPESISVLSRLTKLDLSNNQLTTLPKNIGALSQLTSLNLSGNHLISLPESIGTLSQLKNLDLSGNHLTHLPESLGALSKIVTLNISNNRLTEIPLSFLSMDLPFLSDYNVWQMNNMKGVYIKNTELSIQPISLFDQSRDRSSGFQESRKLIKEYFEEPRVFIREAKVIFLGDGNVGKTYTIQRLRHECRKGDYPTKETHGILIHNLYAKKNGETYKIRVWDFGGQDIMHEMHRCFLTDRTCYVIMVDTRMDKQTRRARYWLRTVQNIAPKTPVLLLVNEFSGGKNLDLDYSSLKQEFSNLVGVEYCSSMDADDDEFRRKVEYPIFQWALKMDSCKMELPKSWDDVRQNLLSLQNNTETGHKRIYYIDRQTFHSLCDQYDIPADDGLRAWLLTWFNDLGICFSYHLDKDGQERSADYKILDPMWLTSAVYKIIWEKEQTDDGLITRSEIRQILKNPGSAAMEKDGIPCLEGVSYNKQECGYVLDIMHMFRISYSANEYIEFMPTLCKPDSKLDPMPKQWKQHAAYRFHYAFLPESVLHRLMIFCFANLRPGKRWRKGFWLECEVQGLSAILRTEETNGEENEIRIDVYAQKEEFETWMWLQPLCKQLAKINNKLSLSTETFILAENDNEKKWFSLNSVWYWRNQGVPNLQGEKSYFPIQPLIDSVFGIFFPEVEKELTLQQGRTWKIPSETFSQKITFGVANRTGLDVSRYFEEQTKILFDISNELKRSNDLKEREIETIQKYANTTGEKLSENLLTLQQSNEILRNIRDAKVQLSPEILNAFAEAFRKSANSDLQAIGQKMENRSSKDKVQLLRDLLGDAANFATVSEMLLTLGKNHMATLLKLILTPILM